MRKQAIWTCVALATAIVASTTTSAEAFCHKYRSIPVWFGVYYPNCGPCGGCIMPYMINCGCGYGCGYGCGSCGYGCGTCAYGCGHGCVKKAHRLCGHRLWKRCLAGCGSCFDGCGDCFDGCGDCGCYDGGCGGCGDGGCGDGGCATGGAGCSSCNGDSNVIYDGPAPADDAPPVATEDQSAMTRRPLILLASRSQSVQQDGSAAFAKGLTAFRQGSMNDAVQQFEAASASEPDNALYHYYRALALHDTVGEAGAEEARQLAVEAELRQPVQGWGKRMERVQGAARLWIEKARREAGLVR